MKLIKLTTLLNFSSPLRYNQAVENITKIEEKNNQIANNIVAVVKNKIVNNNNSIQPSDQNDQKNSDLAKVKTSEENFLASKFKQIAKNTNDIINSLASSNQEAVTYNFDNSQAKTVSVISPSGIGKAIA